MQNYEAAYYLLPKLDEVATQALNEKFSAQLAQFGGESVKVNALGKKRLAYPIKGEEEGGFFVMEFSGKPDTAKELGRVFRITDEVLRSMIVKLNTKQRGAVPAKSE